jgi:hypothetical protein
VPHSESKHEIAALKIVILGQTPRRPPINALPVNNDEDEKEEGADGIEAADGDQSVAARLLALGAPRLGCSSQDAGGAALMRHIQDQVSKDGALDVALEQADL